MARKSLGRCRVCGNTGELSREHPIPRSAGNTGEVWVHSLYSVARGWSRGEHFQNGLTRSTLCAECNGRCGKHYVRPFATWTLKAAEYRERLDGEARVLLPFTVVPLAVAKQIAAIALAMSHAGSIDLPHYLDLRRFVLSPFRTGGFDSFRFYTYFHFGAPTFEGAFYALNTKGGQSPMVHCHVGREPLGYIVTANNSASVRWAARRGLCDLTHFTRREAYLITVEHLWLPCMRGELPFRAPIQSPAPRNGGNHN